MGSKAGKKLRKPRLFGGLGASKWVRKLKKLENLRVLLVLGLRSGFESRKSLTNLCSFDGFWASKWVGKLKRLKNLSFLTVLKLRNGFES